MKKVLTSILVLLMNGSAVCSAQEMTKVADARNQELLDNYNRDYELNTSLIKPKDKPARTGFAMFKISPTSLMSNDDIEMRFEVNPEYEKKTTKGYPLYWYNIILKNKSDYTIYIDKEQCLRVPNYGENYWYCSSEPKMMFEKPHQRERYVEIPPHSEAPLVKNTLTPKAFLSFRYFIEHAEDLTLNCAPFWGGNSTSVEIDWYIDRVFSKFSPRYGYIKVGESREFGETDSPYGVSYYITYSHSKDYRQWSTLYANLYVSHITGMDGSSQQQLLSKFDVVPEIVTVGTDRWMSNVKKNIPQTYVKDYNPMTLIAPIAFSKKYGVRCDGVTEVKLLEDAHTAFKGENYQEAASLYDKASAYGVIDRPALCLESGLSCYMEGTFKIARTRLRTCLSNFFNYEDGYYAILELINDCDTQIKLKEDGSQDDFKPAATAALRHDVKILRATVADGKLQIPTDAAVKSRYQKFARIKNTGTFSSEAEDEGGTILDLMEEE